VLAYHRELRARRRRRWLRRLAGPFAGQGTVIPLLASVVAVCLVAGAMLSVATFSPATAPAEHHHLPTAAASSPQPGTQHPSLKGSRASATPRPSGSRGAASPPTPSARSNPSSRTRHTLSPGAP
jgi:hypothetical protein